MAALECLRVHTQQTLKPLLMLFSTRAHLHTVQDDQGAVHTRHCLVRCARDEAEEKEERGRKEQQFAKCRIFQQCSIYSASAARCSLVSLQERAPSRSPPAGWPSLLCHWQGVSNGWSYAFRKRFVCFIRTTIYGRGY